VSVWNLEDIHTSCRNILLIFIRNLFLSVVYIALSSKIVFVFFSFVLYVILILLFMFIIWCASVASNKYYIHKKVKVGHTRLPSIGFRSWSRFLAVSLQVTRVMNPAVGCQYFPSGLQLPSKPLRGLLPILLLGEQRHDGCKQFA